MMNTHFLYLLGHLRLLEEQHAIVSLNRVGIGLIGTQDYNQQYIQAINHSAHHCELKAVCTISSPIPSASYFMCQKKKIEELINNESVNSIIITSVCSDELLKFTLNAAIEAGKDILLNNIPNYSNEEELVSLLKSAKHNDVRIHQSNSLTFDSMFDELSIALTSKESPDTGLLRFSAHRTIENDDRLPFNTLRAVICEKISLLLNMLPDFVLDSTSIQ